MPEDAADASEAALREASMQALAPRTRHDTSSSSSSSSAAGSPARRRARSRERPSEGGRFNDTVVVRGRVVGGEAAPSTRREGQPMPNRGGLRKRSRSRSPRGGQGDRSRSPVGRRGRAQGERRGYDVRDRSRSPRKGGESLSPARRVKDEKKAKKESKKSKKEAKLAKKERKKQKKKGRHRDRDGGAEETDMLKSIDEAKPKTLDDFNARMQWLRDQVQGTQSVIQNATEKKDRTPFLVGSSLVYGGGTDIYARDRNTVGGKLAADAYAAQKEIVNKTLSAPMTLPSGIKVPVGGCAAKAVSDTDVEGVVAVQDKKAAALAAGPTPVATVPTAAPTADTGGKIRRSAIGGILMGEVQDETGTIQGSIEERKAKSMKVVVPVVEGKAVGGAMTMEQWRAMVAQRAELKAATSGLHAGNEQRLVTKSTENDEQAAAGTGGTGYNKNGPQRGDWECFGHQGKCRHINFRKADKCSKCGAYRRVGQVGYQAPAKEFEYRRHRNTHLN